MVSIVVLYDPCHVSYRLVSCFVVDSGNIRNLNIHGALQYSLTISNYHFDVPLGSVVFLLKNIDNVMI